MKILLIRPPIVSASLLFPQGPRFGLPLGLLYLAAILERENIPVDVYDALIDFDPDHPEKKELGLYHIGAPWNIILENIERRAPDIVGINNPFTDFTHLTITLAERIKKAAPSIITVVGGPHASSSAGSFFSSTHAIDYVIQGEGEISLPLLIRALERHDPPDAIPGVAFRKKAAVFISPLRSFVENLDELPLPAYHRVAMESYFALVKKGYLSRLSFLYPGCEREVSMITSRGCPFACCFCGNHLHMGRPWRKHSAEAVLGHMKLLIEQYGVRHFHFEDDNLTLDRARFDRILSGIIDNRWTITWDTPNGIRADKLPSAVIPKIKASGCTYLIMGVESGSQRVLDEIVKKDLSLSLVEETARLCKKNHINLHAFYIIGFPGETLREIGETLRFAARMLARHDVVPHVSLARPLPGTEMFSLCEQNNWLTEPLLPEIGSALRGEVFERVMIKTPEFSPAYLERAMNSFNRKTIVIMLYKILLFLFFHPTICLRETKGIMERRKNGLAREIKGVVFNRLLFKFCYENPTIRRALKAEGKR